jgi:hypothetical protein
MPTSAPSVWSVYHTLTLPQSGGYVLGADLNRSELSRLLISQGFLPRSVTNRRFQHASKGFSGASVTTAQARVRLRAADELGAAR